MEQLGSRVQKHIDVLVERFPELKDSKENIESAFNLMKECLKQGGKIIVAGNGGSASDAEHIVGELMKCFLIPRPIDKEFAEKLKEIDYDRGTFLTGILQKNLPAITLTNHSALTTAYINDVCSEGVYAQQLLGYGKSGDVFLAISTSGNSQNILNASIVGKAMGLNIVSLTGKSGGDLKKISDVCINVPAEQTHIIQELHLPIYHCICIMLEEYFFGENNVEINE